MCTLDFGWVIMRWPVISKNMPAGFSELAGSTDGGRVHHQLRSGPSHQQRYAGGRVPSTQLHQLPGEGPQHAQLIGDGLQHHQHVADGYFPPENYVGGVEMEGLQESRSLLANSSNQLRSHQGNAHFIIPLRSSVNMYTGF